MPQQQIWRKLSAAAILLILEALVPFLKGNKNGEVRDEREEAIAKQGPWISRISPEESQPVESN